MKILKFLLFLLREALVTIVAVIVMVCICAIGFCILYTPFWFFDATSSLDYLISIAGILLVVGSYIRCSWNTWNGQQDRLEPSPTNPEQEEDS